MERPDKTTPQIRIAGPLPGAAAVEWVNRDHAITSPSNTREYPLVVARASGCFIEDVDGNRFLDFTAGIAVCATGHCHPRVVQAIQQQAASLMHICGSDFYYPVMVELSEKLGALAPWSPQQRSRVYFTNSGTETVEAAIKLARHHSRRKQIIAFHGAFHGRTMGSLALTASKYKQKLGFGPLIPMVAHAEYGSIRGITDVLFKRHFPPAEVAAIFVEPIQGEGGYILPPAGFLADLRALCTREGILLVMDEIQTGIGRTGRWWACLHEDVVPDMICSAKGLASGMPLGALIVKEHIMSWPPGAQGSTFGGNPVCCAAALETLRLVESGYMANAEHMGRVILDGLTQLTRRHPFLRHPRGRGLMIGVDVVDSSGAGDPARRTRIIQDAFQGGLLLLPCGESSFRLTPPLCIQPDEAALGMELLERALSRQS